MLSPLQLKCQLIQALADFSRIGFRLLWFRASEIDRDAGDCGAACDISNIFGTT